MRAASIVVSTALVATALVVPVTARADDESGVLGSRHQRYESPQNFAMEFRFASYKPRIDEAPELGGTTPYRDVFGTMPRLEIAVEFDWQVLRIPHVGTIGPGISVGYTTMSNKAQLKNCTPDPAANKSCDSGEDTSLDIFPMYGVFVLRADVIQRDLHIPLVPYAKAGLGLGFWRASTITGTSTTDGVSGKGHTVGAQFAVGLGLNLNAFDRAASVNLDNAVGINNTYLFFELMSAQLTGLGQDHALFVGTNTWVTGLTFEM